MKIAQYRFPEKAPLQLLHWNAVQLGFSSQRALTCEHVLRDSPSLPQLALVPLLQTSLYSLYTGFVAAIVLSDKLA